MINVVIDSTALRNDPARKKAAFRRIKKLANAGELKLHIPKVVEQEFLSQEIDQYHAGLSEIITKIVSFGKKNLPKGAREILKNQEKQLRGLKEELPKFAKADFEKWVSDVGAEVHPILESHGQKVMEAYFSGSPPFREKKNRKDIPDAFVWQTVLELSEKFENIYVVSNDSGIWTACEAGPNIRSFISFDELISSDVCQAPLKKAQAEENLRRMLSLVPKIVEKLKSTIESEGGDALQGKTVTSEQIPDDNNEGMIMMTGEPEDIEILIDDAKYYGEGLFVIPATYMSECYLNYSLFKSDLYGLSEKKQEKISLSDLNEHYYEVEEDYYLWVKASIALNLGSVALELDEISNEQLTRISRHIEMSFESIEEIEVPHETEHDDL